VNLKGLSTRARGVIGNIYFPAGVDSTEKIKEHLRTLIADGTIERYRQCGYQTKLELAKWCGLGFGGISAKDRITNYVLETGLPRSLFVGGDGRILGTWIMGNDYRVKSGYYGGYPAGYLRRIKALFPEKKHVLHLFSGKVDLSALPGKTVDVNAALKPDYVDDAQMLEKVPLPMFDLVLSDPPYSVEDAERYQTTMVKRNKVMAALGSRLRTGAHVVWLDQVLPMFKKSQFSIEGVIGMVKSTNHRFRVITMFRKI
jgi:hypothetical protein